MRTLVRAGLIICLLALAACGASPETKKARLLENGDKYFEQKQYKEAITEYVNVLKIDGNNKSAQMKLAKVFSTVGEPAKELSFLLKARDIDPDDIELRLKVAKLQLIFDKVHESRDEIEFVLGKDPENIEALGLLAETARTPDDVADAIFRLSAVTPAKENAAKHQVALGRLYLKKGDLSKAENSFLEALTGESNLLEAHLGLGDLAAIKKDFQQAEQEYKAAADLAPDTPALHLRLADFYVFIGKKAEAKSVLQNTFQRTPEYTPALYRLARLELGERNFYECSKLVDRLLQKDPQDIDGRILRTQLMLARGEPAEAEKALLEITNARPDLPFPKFLLGLAYMGKGELINARTSLKNAMEQEPNFNEAALRLAEVDVRTGLFQSANEVLHKLLDKDRGNLEAIVLLSESAKTAQDASLALRRVEPLQLQFKDDPRFNLALAALYLKNNELKKSEQLLNQVLSKEPDSAQGHASLAQVLFRKGDPTQAEKELVKAAQLAPPPSGAQIMLAEFYYEQKKTAEAKKVLEDLLAKSPDYPPASFALAKISFDERNFAETTRLLDAVLAKNPAHLDAQILKGQNNLAQNKGADALKDFDQALKINPSSGAALYLSGLARLQLGDTAGAKASFGETIRVQPDFPDARMRMAELDLSAAAYQPVINNLEPLLEKGSKEPTLPLLLGTAYLGKNEAAKAAPLLQKYAQAKPGDMGGRHLYCLSLGVLGKKSEASKCFEGVVKEFPSATESLAQLVAIDISDKHPDVALNRVKNQIGISDKKAALYRLLGRVHSARKEYDAAEDAFHKAIEIEPNALPGYQELVQVYIAAGKNDKAKSAIEDAIRRDPGNISTLMMSGMFNQQINDIPKARDAYEAVLAIKPNYVPAANNLAYIYCEHLGDMDKALRLARVAKDGSPEDPSVADTLAWVLYKKGNYDWALGYLKESVAKMPENHEVLYHLGMTHYQLGNYDEAKKALNQALKLNSEFSGAAEAKKTLAEMQ